MSDEIHVYVVYKPEGMKPVVSAAELDLLESVFPELVLLAQRFDDSDDD